VPTGGPASGLSVGAQALSVNEAPIAEVVGPTSIVNATFLALTDR
jgi:hypothetical protein